MEFTLKAEGSEYTGHHCAVFEKGYRIDGVDEDEPASTRIKRIAENRLEGTIRSGYSGTEEKIEIQLNLEDKTLLFEILNEPDENYYLPKRAVFE